MDLIERRDNVVAISPAEAGDQRDIFLLGELRGFEHIAHAERVDGDRLFAKHMLAGFDAGAQMHGSKTRRRGENHNVDAAVDQLLIGVQSEKQVLRFDLHLRAVDLAELFEARVDCDPAKRRRPRSVRHNHRPSSPAKRRPVPRPPHPTRPTLIALVALPANERGKSGGEGGSRGLQKIAAVVLLHFVSVVALEPWWGIEEALTPDSRPERPRRPG